MPLYKLMYFNSRGRAEVARLVMAYAGIPYEDVRVETDKWAEVKPSKAFWIHIMTFLTIIIIIVIFTTIIGSFLEFLLTTPIIWFGNPGILA